jgi:hypothetical protein
MQELKQHTTFLRERVALPEGISIFGETFCEGWTLLKSDEASWLDSAIRRAGWNSFVLTKEHWRSGFGPYSQDALQKTVRLALRRIGRNHNVAEIEQIKVTKYLWFYLVKISILASQIQRSPFLGMVDELSVPPEPLAWDRRQLL